MLRLIVVMAASISIPAFSQTRHSPSAKPLQQAPPNPACVPLKNACEKAGYSASEPRTSEKSVVGGCLAKFARGESVKGLPLKPTDKIVKPCVDFMKMKMRQITAKPSPTPVKPVVKRKGP